MSSAKKLKAFNTNNSTKVNFNYEQSSNNCLKTASNKIYDNNITFDNLNYKHTPILQHTKFEIIEQQNDHQSSQPYFMKTNKLLEQIDLLNVMS